MRGFAKGDGIARRRLASLVFSSSASVESKLFEERQAEAQVLRTRQLNAAAVMLNKALAEYSDDICAAERPSR